ncbi:MAG: ubiquinone/menaquinone biosynthesis methyltransferase [Chloroflexaceae bacterium]|nr:ubiquinone/menaquinone biosynthesis methyltransferase [Chloroflexaceae bacterium]
MAGVLPTLEEKASYVERMFTQIAATYDATNRVMTFGLDQGWRQQIVETVAPFVDGRALDVGTGTGDFLPMLAAWMPEGIAVGVDFCLPMMQEGLGKLDGASNPAPLGERSFVGGDALHLPFPDNSFDAITTGFAIRNVTDIVAAFREMWRVARPGGVVACLEVAQPCSPLLRLGHQWYFKVIVPRLGGLLSGNQRAYVYLYESARNFPPPNALARMMREAGWQHVQYRLSGLGAVAIHQGVKL